MPFNTQCYILKIKLLLGTGFFPQKLWEIFLEAFQAVPSTTGRVLNGRVHVLAICVLSLGSGSQMCLTRQVSQVAGSVVDWSPCWRLVFLCVTSACIVNYIAAPIRIVFFFKWIQPLLWEWVTYKRISSVFFSLPLPFSSSLSPSHLQPECHCQILCTQS